MIGAAPVDASLFTHQAPLGIGGCWGQAPADPSSPKAEAGGRLKGSAAPYRKGGMRPLPVFFRSPPAGPSQGVTFPGHEVVAPGRQSNCSPARAPRPFHCSIQLWAVPLARIAYASLTCRRSFISCCSRRIASTPPASSSRGRRVIMIDLVRSCSPPTSPIGSDDETADTSA